MDFIYCVKNTALTEAMAIALHFVNITRNHVVYWLVTAETADTGLFNIAVFQ